MQVINYINLFKYLNMVIPFDVVLYLHVLVSLAKNRLCVSINLNSSNFIVAKHLKPTKKTIVGIMKSYTALDKMVVPATPFFFKVHFPVVNPKI
jgi:hypothetical protein